jgi:GT2 family glycosyltransferase
MSDTDQQIPMEIDPENPNSPDSGLAPGLRVLAVVPTLGERLETLSRTLHSIADQKDTAVDIVIVTPRLSTEILEIAGRFGAMAIANDGHISAAINAALNRAGPQHRYMLWLGDDDVLRPGALAAACQQMERHPSSVVAYGDCDYMDLRGNILFTRRPPRFAPFLLRFLPGLIKQEACLFRMQYVLAIGGLDESLRYTMDLDLLLRLQNSGPFLRIDKVMAAFCWHPGSITIANRLVSLSEAQTVQGKHARGLTSIVFWIMKRPVRYLIVLLDQRINSSLRSPMRNRDSAEK